MLARWLSASGRLGPTIDLFPGGSGFEPQVGMAPSGRAFAIWRSATKSESTVYGRWVEANGSLGPLLTLGAPDPGKFNPVEDHVTVDPAGVATVSLRNDAGGNPFIVVRRIAPDSGVGPMSEKIGSGGGLEIAALPNGSTVVVWRSVGTELNVVGPNLEVGTAQTVSSNSSTADPTLAVDSHGNGLVAWRDDSSGTFTLRGIRLDPTGVPVGGEIMIDPSAPAGLSSRMSIASDTAGDFLVAWVRYIPPGEGVLHTRGLDPTGEFRGPPEPVSAAGGLAEDLIGSIIDDRGTGALAWPDFTMSTATVIGRTIDSAGIPSGAISTFAGARAGPVFGAAEPALGFAAFLTHQNEDVLVRRFLEPPLCRDSEATVTQGRPIAVLISCTGPGIETAVAGAPGHGRVAPFDTGSLSFRYTPTPGFNGTDRFTYTASNDGGPSNSVLVTIKVGKDTIKPRIKRFRFIRGKHDKFVLKLSEPGRVAITVEALVGGAKQSKRSVVGRAKSKKASRNVVIRPRGKLAKKLRAGGRFRATAVATDLARNRSKPRRLKLRLAPRPLAR